MILIFFPLYTAAQLFPSKHSSTKKRKIPLQQTNFIFTFYVIESDSSVEPDNLIEKNSSCNMSTCIEEDNSCLFSDFDTEGTII